MRKEKRHCLTNINKIDCTATCSQCGPLTPVRHKSSGKNRRIWRCRKAWISMPSTQKTRNRKQVYKAFKIETCERCNFIPENPCQLDVHHKDGDHENNQESNLQTLCANCHRLITFLEGQGFYRRD